MSGRDLKRSRLSANAGSIKQRIYFALVDAFTTIGALPAYTQATADHDVADISARDAIVSPTADDIAYVQSNQLFYKYVAASTSWVRAFQSVISTSHVFPADQGFYVVEGTKNTRGLEFTGPDDYDVTGFDMVLNFNVPGLDPALIDFINKSGLESFIVIIETNEGKMIQLGDANNPANLKVGGGGTGTERLNYKGLQLMVAYDGDPAFYEGGALDLMTD